MYHTAGYLRRLQFSRMSFNVPQADYFHCCIIRDIKHPMNDIKLCSLICNIYTPVLNHQTACMQIAAITDRVHDCLAPALHQTSLNR